MTDSEDPDQTAPKRSKEQSDQGLYRFVSPICQNT